MSTKSILAGVPRACSPALVLGRPCFEELVLPKSVEIGNISLDKAVIWGMSDKVVDRKASPISIQAFDLEGKLAMLKISAVLAISLALCTTAYAGKPKKGTCYTENTCTTKISKTTCGGCIGSKGEGWIGPRGGVCKKKC